MFQLTEHFYRETFYALDEAEELGIDNTPPIVILPYIEQIAWRMEVIWKHYNKPVKIIRCFQCKELNDLLGGDKYNRHLYGAAVDFYVEGIESREVINHIPILFPRFDNVCLYSGMPDWMHIDFSYNRKLIIDRTKKNGSILC